MSNPKRAGASGLLSEKARLVLLSFLMLFAELALIRWTGSNVLYLSYFSNFVLLGSFLGIGLGFLRARARRNFFVWAPAALALLVGFVRIFPVGIERSGSELLFFGQYERTGLPAWITLPVLFVAVATVMGMIAEGVARTFAKFEPLEAYRLDILGGIAGISAFSVLARVHAPPLVWGAVVSLLFAALFWPRITPVQVGGVVALLMTLGAESLSPVASWSPYYTVRVFPPEELNGPTRVTVNSIPHQDILSVTQLRVSAPIYFLAYEHVPTNPLRDVLVIGAGTGNDVAVALWEGARHVDAVEIDLRLYQIGRQLHPDRPYQDPRVEVRIDDGRAFLEQTERRYDLILFALPDSLTLVAGQSSLRLESYLFTLEAIREAREHLKPGGAFAMYNYYREEWLIDRLAGTLERAYGHPPCVDSVGGRGRLALLVTSASSESVLCESLWQPGPSGSPEPVGDDYPFLYLRERGIPGFYLAAVALMVAVSTLLVRVASGPLRQMVRYFDLFLMGAAFLLLETKSVVQFALLFGTTWFVNAIVFAGILLAVLAAIEVARRLPLRRPFVLNASLFAALALAWAVPAGAMLALPFPLRFVLATAIAFTPIFLANLVFAQRFKNVGSSTVAFGANLLGAMLGGILEYGALLFGYRALLVLVAAFYGLAFLARPRVAGPAMRSAV